LELALERWRHNSYNPNRPAIIVNLPEFRLRAYRANHLDLEMKVVVGKAPERKTPLLQSRMASIIFRPYWNVPLSIQEEEMVPAILDDPDYLATHDLEMVNAQGVAMHGDLSDGRLAQLETGQLRLRQIPGPENALGLVKFVFPNAYGVYMHDTSVRSVFYRERRDLSHGCIRVEKAEELAEWLLRDRPGWSRDRIVEAMQGPGSTTVKLSQSVQVLTMYVTAVAQESGEVHFFDDIYEEDEAPEEALAAHRAGG
jgi:murein L,D-transpeptidase YcbB/YkuD